MATIQWKTTLNRLMDIAASLHALCEREERGGLLRVVDAIRDTPELKEGVGRWGYGGWARLFEDSCGKLQVCLDAIRNEGKQKPTDEMTPDYIQDFASRLIRKWAEVWNLAHLGTEQFLRVHLDWSRSVGSAYADFTSKYNQVVDKLGNVKPELHSLSQRWELEEWRLNHIPGRLEDLLKAP